MNGNKTTAISAERRTQRGISVLAFFVPAFIMLILFIIRGIYPFGDRSFLFSDMYHQYMPFLSEFVHKIKAGEGLSYSYNVGIGTNFLALYVYYVASPFNWLVFLLPESLIMEFMSYLVILRIGLMGLTFSIYLRKTFGKADPAVILFSTCYALSGYLAAYNWNVMWLDCLILLPLILLGAERLARTITTMGNGRLDAVSNAIKTYFGITYELSVYEEHAISRGSNSKAATYVGIVHDGKFYWGVGVDEDIIKSSIAALVSAVNKLAAEQHITSGREERIVEIISFIQKNYVDVTLDMLVDTFHLSKPYLSKYIKEKAGMTFQEVVREERMKKARMLLKETNQTVETIAANVGYENVEHFNRLFKKAYDMTPVQYRKQSAE